MFLSWWWLVALVVQVFGAGVDLSEEIGDNYLSDLAVQHYHGNWSFSVHCLNDTRLLFRDLQNLTLWATTMWDASAQQPSGLLYGTTFQLGNFDECLEPALVIPYGILPQYCLTDVTILQSQRHVGAYDQHEDGLKSALDKIYYTGDKSRRRRDMVHWAVCVPASCSADDVQALMEGYFNYTSTRVEPAQAALRFQVHLDQYSCQVQTQAPYTNDTLAFFILIAVLFTVGTACSVAHWCLDRRAGNLPAPDTRVPALVLAFSALEHARKLGGTGPASGGSASRALFGLRYLSILMVVLDHRIGTTASGPLDNWQFIEKRYQEVSSMLITHGDLLVDTFFVLGGFLVVRPLMSGKKSNPLVVIISRYIRLVPGYAIMMFYTASAAPHLGRGPLWSRVVGEESRACSATWWWGLLMLGNYVQDDRICMTSSWYIPCDFHLFACAVLMCGVLRARPKSGLAVLCAALLAGVLAPGLVTAYYRLPALLHFYDEFLLNPRSLPTMRLVYTKSHTRAASYVIGLLAGYAAYRLKPGAKKISKYSNNSYVITRCVNQDAMIFGVFMNIWFTLHKGTVFTSKSISSVGAVLSLGILLAAFTSGAIFYEPGRPYNLLEASLYAALNRPMWAVGISLLMLCLIFGQIPLLSSLLGWRAWVPLSKLSYGVYLVHMQMQIADVASLRQPQHLSHLYILHRWLGDVVVSTSLALLLYLLVEAPSRSLFYLALRTKPRVSSSHSQRNNQNSIKVEDVESNPAERGLALQTMNHLRSHDKNVILSKANFKTFNDQDKIP